MKVFTTFCILFVIGYTARGQQAFVQMDKEQYLHGDSIKISCRLPEYNTGGIRYASLFLFIEEIATRKHWAYRYPLVDGFTEAALYIDSSMHDGKYAFSFQVKKGFFSINGAVETGEQMDLSYAMLTHNGATLFDNVKTDINGSFSLKGLLFEDTCYFVFSPVAKTKQAGLKIDINTPLDSSFVSDKTQVNIISVGNAGPVTAQDKLYQVDANAFIGKTTLPDVVVSASRKKKVELFDEEFSSGLFKNGTNVRIFDGLEENKIAQSSSIIDFLRGAVAGLRIIPSAGSFILQWRGVSSMRSPNTSNVDVFVDEFQLTQLTEDFMSPADVAMIKAYPPPAYLSPGGQRAAIAIYTKRGGYDNDNLFRNKFKVFGYSAPASVWK